MLHTHFKDLPFQCFFAHSIILSQSSPVNSWQHQYFILFHFFFFFGHTFMFFFTVTSRSFWLISWPKWPNTTLLQNILQYIIVYEIFSKLPPFEIRVCETRVCCVTRVLWKNNLQICRKIFMELEYHKKFSKFFHGTWALWKTRIPQTRVPKKW